MMWVDLSQSVEGLSKTKDRPPHEQEEIVLADGWSLESGCSIGSCWFASRLTSSSNCNPVLSLCARCPHSILDLPSLQDGPSQCLKVSVFLQMHILRVLSPWRS